MKEKVAKITHQRAKGRGKRGIKFMHTFHQQIYIKLHEPFLARELRYKLFWSSYEAVFVVVILLESHRKSKELFNI